MKQRKKKIIGAACYLLFTLVCGILRFVLEAQAELLFCIWYLGTVCCWLLLWIRVIERLGKRKKTGGKKK